MFYLYTSRIIEPLSVFIVQIDVLILNKITPKLTKNIVRMRTTIKKCAIEKTAGKVNNNDAAQKGCVIIYNLLEFAGNIFRKIGNVIVT